jgi:uncharacterized membrane protein
MLIRAVILSFFLFPSVISGLSFEPEAVAAGGIELYTPFTNISVPPGETVNYTVDLLNNGSTTKNVHIYVASMPKGWDYSMKSGGWNIRNIAILPGGKQSLALKVAVPLKVEKGDYRFTLVAGGLDELPLTINVSEKGTYKTEFTCDQTNMEGNSKSTFTFKATLKNETADNQRYALQSNAPRGWDVTFKPDYKQATSVEIDPNTSKVINIDVKPPEFIPAGAYKIPVRAMTNSTTGNLELEVVVTGTYEMDLTTPDGLLSTRVTAGGEKKLPLVVKNTGSADLKDISFHASAPSGWSITFDPSKIDKLDAGKTDQVVATMKSSDKAIAGDYAATITASTPEVSSKAAFRISVRTPMLWGWVGILIILIAIGSVYYLFRKYGRR